MALFQQLEQKDGIAECLEGLAQVALLRQDAPLAVLLYSCAAAIRTVVGVPLPPTELHAFERELATLRGALSETRFELAWARGRSLPPDEAIALALADPA